LRLSNGATATFLPTIPVMLVAEELVGEARERRASEMARREKLVTRTAAVLFLLTAGAMAFLLPDERQPSLLLVAGLVVGYAVLLQVRFEFGDHYASAETLVFVPLLLLGPLPYLPLLEALGVQLALLPAILRGDWHRDQLLSGLADCWIPLPAVLVLAWLAPGPLAIEHIEVYLAAYAAYYGNNFLWAVGRDTLAGQVHLGEVARDVLGGMRVESMLIPVAFVVTLQAHDEPLYLLAIFPLAGLFYAFSNDRHERYTKALELQRAYRGTVMLLSDVVENEDSYTAHHSRSVVELVNATADELGVPDQDRQELEFAAMLHDVGKIAISKDILNKPAKLTDSEFEVMKTHTIEGQFLLDRVGGLLGRVGEIVRSCHERWDGQGYPDGLAGEAIPFPSRIVFCCDAYNAMTTDRVYRKAMPMEAAIQELESNAGTQFDPTVVAALTRVVKRKPPEGSFSSDEVRALLAGAGVGHAVGTGAAE
jgi:HD-GYP domain-containing protein (c-di-GMP phosphodiesterase class II)